MRRRHAVRGTVRRAVGVLLLAALWSSACADDDRPATGAGAVATVGTGGQDPPADGAGGEAAPPAAREDMDAAVVALTALPEEEFCGLLPAADVVRLAGTTTGTPSFAAFEDLGTNCLHYDEDGQLVAKVEIGVVAYADFAAVATLDLGADAPPAAAPCAVAGRPALCTEPYTDAGGRYATGAQVIVALGADTDPYLLVELPEVQAALEATALVLQRLG